MSEQGEYAYELFMQGFAEVLNGLGRWGETDEVSEELVYRKFREAVSAGVVPERKWGEVVSFVTLGTGALERGQREKYDMARWMMSPSETLPGWARKRLPRKGLMPADALDGLPAMAAGFREHLQGIDGPALRASREQATGAES